MEFTIRLEELFIFFHASNATLNYNNSGKFPEFTNDTESKNAKVIHTHLTNRKTTPLRHSTNPL